MSSLTIAGCVCGLLALFVLPWLFAPVGLLLGVVALTKGRVENGIAVIVLAGACGYYGVSAPANFIDELWSSVDLKTVLQPGTKPAVEASAADWSIVSLETQMITSSNADPVCSWKLVVKNDSAQPAVFHGSIEFQDAHGVKVSQDQVEGAAVGSGSVGVFTGSLTIKSRTKVARAVPQISAGD
jgi:hypothetical protein